MELAAILKPGVIGAVIDLGNCLDLVAVENLKTVRGAYRGLCQALVAGGGSIPKNTGSDFGARKLDCAVFEFLHKARQKASRPQFDAIRAFFVEGKPLYEGAQIRTLDHVQICVRNPRQIVGYFLPRKGPH